jgi:iron complex transport system permease protein
MVTDPRTALGADRRAAVATIDRRVRGWAHAALLAGLAILLLVSAIAAVGIGPVAIPFSKVWAIIGHNLLPAWIEQHGEPGEVAITWDLRLPRVLLGGVVGAGLAVVGVVIQALLRNPLADPYVIGISAGASFGAVSVIVTGATILGVASVPLAAFSGALAAFVLVFLFARQGAALSPLRLVLAGVAVAALLGAITNYMVLSASDERVRGALFWTLGGLVGAHWAQLGIPSMVVVALTAYFIVQGRALDALAFGDETATTLGVDVERFRLVTVVLAALLTGVLVAVSGGIGFVALILPHAVRLIVGADHRRVLPTAALVGALFLIWVDVAARMLIRPAELPIGVITSGIGAPVFLLLLRWRAKRFGGAP